MSAGEERNKLQRTIVFGLLFVFLLLIAILAGYIFLGRPPAASPTTAPPPVDTPAPSVTPASPPVAPSNLTAENVAVYDIKVGWQDNSDNEDGFNVYRQRTDVQGDLIKAGSTGADTTDFVDPYTYCGETYEYIVASYNSLGESPTGVCWSISLPPCPDPKTLTENAGMDKGYNFLTGARGANSDFYLNMPTGAQPSFMADQGGQLGLLDLGEVGEVPLWHVDLPRPTSYVRAGVQTVKGHTYAALATDGKSVIVSTVNELGQDANLSYIVWKPGDEKTGECTVGRNGQTPPPPKTCECKDGNMQVPGIAAVASDQRCEAHPNATCECHGDDLVLSNLLVAVFPKDPICTGGTCECKGPDWVCSNGYTYPSSPRCTQQECKCEGTTLVCPNGRTPNSDRCVPGTQPPQDCGCRGTSWVCPDGTKIDNDKRCTRPTETVTEPPPPNEKCFCDVENNAWNGNFTCVNPVTGAVLRTGTDPGMCPPPVCGNHNVEGNEECDGGGCGQNATCTENCTCERNPPPPTCTCIPDNTTSGAKVGHCKENPNQRCTP